MTYSNYQLTGLRPGKYTIEMFPCVVQIDGHFFFICLQLVYLCSLNQEAAMLRTNYEVMFCKNRKTSKKLPPLKNFLNLKKILKYRYYIYLHNIHDLSFRPYVKLFLETSKIFIFV